MSNLTDAIDKLEESLRASKAAELLDELEKAASRLGASTPAAAEFHRAMDELQRSLGQGITPAVAEAIEKLDKLKGAIEGGIPDELSEVTDAIGRMEESLRASRAAELLKGLEKSAASMDGGTDAAKDFQDAVEALRSSIGVGLTPEMIQAIEKLDKLKGAVEGVGKENDKGVPAAQKFHAAIGVLQSALHGVSLASQVAHFAIDGFSNLVQGVAGKIGGLVKLVNPAVFDAYQTAFNAFNAQLGDAFLPVMVGLKNLVQTVANAIAGLTPGGKQMLVFLAGAAAGLTAAVTIGGIFLGVLGGVAGGLVAGTAALEAFGVGLDAATFGVAAIGAAIGTAITAFVGTAGAAAGGLGALGLASGSLSGFTDALKPFLELLTGSLNDAAERFLPQLTQALSAAMPAVTRLFETVMGFLPPIMEVLVTFATDVLPPMIDILAELIQAALPFVVVMSKIAVVLLKVAGFFAQLEAAILRFSNAISPAQLLTGGRGSGPRSPGGNAPAPITGANYTNIEELYKKSQQQAVLGQKVEVKTKSFEEVMSNNTLVGQWANAFAEGVGRAIDERLGWMKGAAAGGGQKEVGASKAIQDAMRAALRAAGSGGDA